MLTYLKAQAKLTKPISMDQSQIDSFYNSYAWKLKRRAIKRRDNKECQVCKRNGGVALDNLIAHHIKPLEFFPSLKLSDDNLITVCHDCHEEIHDRASSQWDDEWW